MGNCTSCLSSHVIHENEHGLHEHDHDRSLHIVDGNQHPGSAHCRQGAKGPNQDSVVLHQGYLLEDGAFCGVFDGHGENGHIVSKKVRNQLPSLLLDHWKRMEWKEAFLKAFEEMDSKIEELENVDCSVSGASAVVVIKQGNDLFIANLGDSRAVLGTLTEKNEIQATQLTVDLKPDVPAEGDRIRGLNGRVFAHEAEPHIQRVWLPDEDRPGLAMSRAFGDFDLKKHGVTVTPEVSHHTLSSKDLFLVLATDGVWDVLSNEEAVSIVKDTKGKNAAAEAVVDEAREAWKQKFPKAKVDDCSVICLFLKDPEDD